MGRLRIVFMGTADLSCASLEALVRAEFVEVLAVVTQPDRPKGRELRPQASPVKRLAQEMHLPVLQPERARETPFVEQLRQLSPELIVVAAYGQLLPETILNLPKFGCVNVHTSLLPKYRGAAPIQWALLQEEAETGITIMKMDAGLDTGDILSQESTAIQATDDAQTLHDRLARMGAALLLRTIPEYIAGRIEPKPQASKAASYAPKIKKQDGLIDWRQPARAIWSRIRGLTPWPGAYTYQPGLTKPHLLKVWQVEVTQGTGQPGQVLHVDKTNIVVACGQEALRILSLQLEGGRRLSAQEFLSGHPLQPGQTLGEPVQHP